MVRKIYFSVGMLYDSSLLSSLFIFSYAFCVVFGLFYLLKIANSWIYYLYSQIDYFIQNTN